ncbi:hypothetical protein [Taklimakanibacter albus]|uniref:Uncharacterized protein n=1 Tax=Taklimakanibacter albus TaxID=2800327 RepID=A0ACC5RG76_9HYPH|nr:hypothetical protein [Aestuariivirga sp. YIM B02566]MBK1871593.1 hypothetical protein [Aestuariivirga sp. YIM B02566]
MHTPKDGKTLLIHKVGEEGTIEIDAMTGQLVTPVDDRPEWADKLAAASLAERIGWYEQRVGKTKAAEHLTTDGPIAFQDLTWVGLDDEQTEVEIEADNDFRMQCLGELLGIDLEAAEKDADFGKVLADVSVAHQPQRTDAELAEMSEADKQGFGVSSDQKDGEQKRTATGA